MTQLKYLIMCESFVAFLFAADCHEDSCYSLTQLWTTHTLLTVVYCVYSFRLLVLLHSGENYITEIPTEIGLLTNLEGIELCT